MSTPSRQSDQDLLPPFLNEALDCATVLGACNDAIGDAPLGAGIEKPVRLKIHTLFDDLQETGTRIRAAVQAIRATDLHADAVSNAQGLARQIIEQLTERLSQLNDVARVLQEGPATLQSRHCAQLLADCAARLQDPFNRASDLGARILFGEEAESN